MNKLFYEVKDQFNPQFYIVLMGNSVKGDWQPVNFSPESGRFGFDSLAYDPSPNKDTAEIYDRETVMKLLAHHALNSASTGGYELRLVPVYIPSTLSGASECPYLNDDASMDDIVQLIEDSASNCRKANPDAWEEAWCMPASLGGLEIVPAEAAPSMASESELEGEGFNLTANLPDRLKSAS